MMRSRFDKQLSLLNEGLIEMGGLIEQAISQATAALIKQNSLLASEVIANNSVMVEKEKDIESLCLKILLSQQPVASDLRQVSAALKMITDIKRIGDQAANIAEIGVDIADQKSLKRIEQIPLMADITIKMVTESINAYVKKNQALAEAVIAYDDYIDRIYVEIKKAMIDLVHEDVQDGEQAFDLMQIAKYYERIGDHATNSAEWAIFSITGKHKGKNIL